MGRCPIRARLLCGGAAGGCHAPSGFNGGGKGRMGSAEGAPWVPAAFRSRIGLRKEVSQVSERAAAAAGGFAGGRAVPTALE